MIKCLPAPDLPAPPNNTLRTGCEFPSRFGIRCKQKQQPRASRRSWPEIWAGAKTNELGRAAGCVRQHSERATMLASARPPVCSVPSRLGRRAFSNKLHQLDLLTSFNCGNASQKARAVCLPASRARLLTICTQRRAQCAPILVALSPAPHRASSQWSIQYIPRTRFTESILLL